MATTTIGQTDFMTDAESMQPIITIPQSNWTAGGTPVGYTLPENRKFADSNIMQFARDVGPAGIAGLGAQAGQLALAYIPTEADKYANKVISQYEARGPQGLSGREAALYQSQLMNPVQALAAETQMRNEAVMGAEGGQRSAADVRRGQAETQQRVDQAAQQAGTQLVAADIQARNEELQEYKQALAQKSEKQKQIKEQWSGLLGGTAQVLGQAAATREQRMGPRDQVQYFIDTYKMSPEDAAAAVYGARRTTFAPEANFATITTAHGDAGR